MAGAYFSQRRDFSEVRRERMSISMNYQMNYYSKSRHQLIEEYLKI